MKLNFKRKNGALVALALVLAGPAVPLMAQNATTATTAATAEARLRQMEAEIRALQRQVFPGGDGRYFPAQVQPSQAATTAAGTPATTPVADLLTRMESLEAQIARLTSQSELNTNRIAQLEARVNALPPAATATPTPAPTPVVQPVPTASATPTPRPSATPTTAATGPSAQRLAAVRAVEKPQTDDPGDDEYSYGYRLWEARFYPESEQQLRLFLQRYPRHSRVSFARNLLGRAYLDEGNFDEAGRWFLQNHQADSHGARAPDSLLFLAETMRRKRDMARACIALNQFAEDYAAEAAGRLKPQYDQTRAGVRCN